MLAFAIISSGPITYASAQSDKTFSTRYTTVHYTNDKDLSDFLWRLGGTRIDIAENRELASNRVDRILDRVQTILDMYPKKLRIDIFLTRDTSQHNDTAYYQNKDKSIYINVDKVSDGVFAHEVSHAVVDRYFSSTAPSKVQEIITQYVDRYLWSDY